MKRGLETYEITLTTVGPVFVGNGREISKKSLFLSRREICVMDEDKLYGCVCKRNLAESYEGFLLGRGRETLRDWLEKNRIPESEIRRCTRYTFENKGSLCNCGLMTMECIKDAYGQPYIPGSSLKGMFRTVLLAADILEHGEKYRRVAAGIDRVLKAQKSKGRKILTKEILDVEAERYRLLDRNIKTPNDAVNDIMSGFIVSDSEPLRQKDLILCQKVERHTDGTEKKLNLLRECIRPGRKIRFALTIDTSICSITIDQIKRAIELFNDQYYENFVKAFKGMDRTQPDQVFIGGGSGFVSKTVLYPLYGKKDGMWAAREVFHKTGVSPQHKHERDLQYGASPHIIKCTEFEGHLYQMGLCRCEFRDFAAQR